MHKIKYLILICILLCTGCSKDEHEDPVEPGGSGGSGGSIESVDRTLIVYLGRDSNLSASYEEKKTNILNGWNAKAGNIIIYEDIKNELPVLYKVIQQNKTNTLEIIETYEEENSASAEVFSRVLTDAKKIAPADSYGLLFFSHASGWLPEGVFENTRSIGMDGSNEMEIWDFANAIPDGMFDFIVFEACFMAGIEVLYELKDKTDYILGSSAEIISPGFREIYKTSVDYLFQKEADLVSFAKNNMTFVNEQSGAYKSGTISVIKTTGLDNLAQFIKTNATGEFIGAYNNLQHFDRKDAHLFYDFEDYFSYLVPTSQQSNLQQLISDCVVYEDCTPTFFDNSPRYNGFAIKKHCGITTYIAKDSYPYTNFNEAYKQLAWYKAIYN